MSPHPLPALFMIAALLPACAPYGQHQSSWPDARVLTSDGEIVASRNVAIVELDEQGDLWEPLQLKASLQMISEANKPLLITFIHGWRHDARESDSDLKLFTALIDRLNQSKPGGFAVRGLFVGWRGGSIDENYGKITTPAAVFSFWDRKNAADRMSDIGLARILNQTSAAAWAGNGRTVAIGHSFGGRILEHTCGITMASQSGSVGSLKPIADLVVLINPASESLTARKIKLALQTWKKDAPLFVAIGTKNDGANGTAWPWGYRFSKKTLDRSYQYPNLGDYEESQQSYMSVTTTNDKRQFTHVLEEDKTEQAVAAKSVDALNLGNLNKPEKETFWLRHDRNEPGKRWFLREQDPTKVQDKDLKFIIDSDAYWVFQVEPEILSGHSGDRNQLGIFTTEMEDLLSGIFAKADLANRGNASRTITPSTAPLKVTPTATSLNTPAQ